MTSRRAVVVGIARTEVTRDERELFQRLPPYGFILFARNVEDPDQLAALVRSLRDAIGDPRAPVLVDQEGGRVARLRPPHWRAYPAARRLGELAEAAGTTTASEAVRLLAKRMALDLHAVGINVICAPVLDLAVAGAHDIVGDRAFGSSPDLVTALGHAAIEGFLAGGCVPVIKHVPGHGRARVDSHASLPVVDASPERLAASDFLPFHDLANAPAAMMAHIRFEALDPEEPASCSRTVVQDLVRGMFGFQGLLLSDDLDMGALSGPMAHRVERSMAAGLDLALQCNGDLATMDEALAAAPVASATVDARWRRALARVIEPSSDARTLDAALAAFDL